MPVSEIITSPVAMLGVDATVADAAQAMHDHHVGALLVTDEGDLVGLVTDRDITVSVIAEEGDVERTPVANIMTREPTFVRDHAGIFEAIRVMQRANVRRLPVVDQHLKPVGIITADDLLIYISNELGTLAKALFRGLERERSSLGDLKRK
ncbi:MAG: CBS domain-containing protein [Nitrospirota bacterium]|jgi:CBS domain-containing protein